MPLDALDEFDVHQSFEVMDEEKIDRITLGNFHLLYLGLGFQPSDLTLNELREKVALAVNRRRRKSGGGAARAAEDLYLLQADVDSNESFIPLSLVLEILSEHSRDRTIEMTKCFQLLDQDNKGYVTQEDIQRLSKEVGEIISAEEAKAMLTNKELINSTQLKKVFSPPSP
jgi:Ca2+-binding EF-hand superfamily protein